MKYFKPYTFINHKCKSPNRDGNFAPLLSALPHVGFSRPAKVVGWGWGEILTSQYGVGWGWV